ncbi:MAG: fibronectin type III domain-containing protein [Chloroflexi bacterium]|nr:fibronectin type III domain-containing protein [Chloroflexota bacterium]
MLKMVALRFLSLCLALFFGLVPLAYSQPPPPADPQLKCDSSGLFLQWRAVEKARHYRYRLIDEDGKRLLQARTTNTSVNLGAGQPGENYTAKVRVKTKGSISKWASATVKCPAPPPAPAVTLTINQIYSDRADLEWTWKHLPASTVDVAILMRPKDTDGNCSWIHSRTIWPQPPPLEGKDAAKYYPVCSDTEYYWAFVIADASGILTWLKEEYFRTPPYTDQSCSYCMGEY